MARRLEEIFDALQGTIKTRQQAAVSTLLSLLRDPSDPIGVHFDSLATSLPSKENQIDTTGSSSPSPADLFPQLFFARSSANITSVPEVPFSPPSSPVKEWTNLLVLFCTHYTKVIDGAEGKKSNYDTVTLAPATDALIELSTAIRRHNLFLPSSAVDCVLDMIASTANMLQTKLLFPRMIQAFQLLIGKCESQGLIGTPSKFRLVARRLLDIINTQEQTRGGFQRVAEMLRVIVASTNAAYFFQGAKRAEFVSLLADASVRALEHFADSVTARELVNVINFFLKRHLLNDIENLARPLVAQLNDVLAARLSDQRVHEGLLQSIVACLQLQMRLFIRPDGEMIEIPSFQQIAASLRRYISSNAGSRTKNIFFVDPTDKMMRMEPASFKMADLMSDVILRLHLSGASWPDMDNRNSGDEPAAKKRKLGEGALETFLQIWTSCRDSDLAGWTRVLLVFVRKYPKCIETEKLIQTANTTRERCGKIANNHESECYLLFSLVSVLDALTHSLSPADLQPTLVPIIPQILETLSVKINQNKMGSPVLEAALRAMNAVLEMQVLAPLFHEALEEQVVTLFNSSIWKHFLYSQNTMSTSTALAARLAANCIAVVGSSDDGFRIYAKQLLIWALACVNNFVSGTGDDSAFAVLSFGGLVSRLLGPSLVMDPVPPFVPNIHHMDDEMKELASIETARLLDDDLAPRHHFAFGSHATNQRRICNQNSFSPDFVSYLQTWATEVHTKVRTSSQSAQRLFQCLAICVPTSDKTIDSLLNVFKELAPLDKDFVTGSIPIWESSCWLSALRSLQADLAPFRETFAKYCLIRIDKAVHASLDASSGSSPVKKSEPSPLGKGRGNEKDVIEVDLDDSFEKPSAPEMESSGSFSSDSALAAQQRGMADVLAVLFKDMKHRKEAAYKMDAILSSVACDLSSQLLAVVLNTSDSATPESSIELLVRLCRRSLEKNGALEPDRIVVSSSVWRASMFSNLRALVRLWAKSTLKKKDELNAFVSWCAAFVALCLATDSVKAAILASNNEECQSFIELLSELIVAYSGEEYDAISQALVDLQNSASFSLRKSFARGVTSVFLVFDDHMKPFSDLVENIHSGDSLTIEHVASSVVLLSSLASCSLQLELPALSFLVSRFIMQDYRQIITKVLQKTALRIGYPTATAWVRRHVCFLLSDLRKHGLNALDILAEILGSNRGEFFSEFAPEIAAYVAATDDGETLNLMARALEIPESDLLFDCYPIAFARHLPHSLDRDSPYHQMATKALKFFDTKKWVQSDSAKVECLVASSGIVVSEVLGSSLNEDSIAKCLQALSRKLGSRSCMDAVADGGQLHTMLLAVCRRFVESTRDFQRSSCVKSLDYMWKACCESNLLAKMGVAGEFLLAYVRMGLYEKIFIVLATLKGSVNLKDSIGFVIPKLVSLLLKLLVQPTPDTGAVAASLLKSFIWLFDQPELEDALSIAPLLPRELHASVAALERCATKQHSLLTTLHPKGALERIKYLVNMASSIYVPSCSQQESLRTLRAELKSEIKLPADILRWTVSQLFALVKGRHDDNTRSLAMECLSTIDVIHIPTLMDEFLNESVISDGETELRFPFIRAESKILTHLLHLIYFEDPALAEAASAAFVQVVGCVNEHIGTLKLLVDEKVLLVAIATIKVPTVEAKTVKLPLDCLTWLTSDTYSSWISRATCTLLKATQIGQLRACAALCKIYQPLSEALFPHSFAALSQEQPKELKAALEVSVFAGVAFPPEALSSFVQAFATTLRLSLVQIKGSRRSLITELFPRRDAIVPASANVLQRLSKSTLIWESDPFWNQINLNSVSELCLRGGSALAALQFLELEVERHPMQQTDSLLVDIYEKLNEPDCLQALTSFASPTSSEWRVQALLYSQEAKWHNAIAIYNQQLTHEKIPANRVLYHRKIIESLTNDGQLQVAESYLNGISLSDSAHMKGNLARDLRSLLAWRLRRWESVPASDSLGSTNQGILSILSLEREQKYAEMEVAHVSFRSLLLQRLRHNQDLLKAAVEIHQHQSLSEIISVLIKNDKDALRATAHRWLSSLRDVGKHPHRFDSLEPLTLMRNLIIENLPNPSATAVLQLARIRAAACRSAGRFQPAASSVAEMMIQLNSLKESMKNKFLVNLIPCKLEEGQLAWARGDLLQAIQHLKRLLVFCETDGDFLGLYEALKTKPEHIKHFAELNEHLAATYSCAGEWFLNTKMENSSNIQEHLEKAIKFYSATSDPSRGHFELARFLDFRWAALIQSERSPEAEVATLLKKNRKNELEDSKGLQSGRADTKVANSIRKLQLLVDKDAKEEAEATQIKFELIGQTFTEWLTVLVQATPISREHILHAVFRVISIWFSTAMERDDLSRSMLENADNIPVDRFIPLFYQMASRISIKTHRSGNATAIMFQNALFKIIKLMLKRLPHHSLPTLYSLSKADIVKPSHATYYKPDEDKKETAVHLLREVSLQDSTFKRVMDQTVLLFDAYVELAFQNQAASQGYPTSAARKAVPKKLGSIKNLDLVEVPTYSGKGNAPHVTSFQPYYDLVGGVTAPKAIYCQGSDGRWYKQLVKGPSYAPSDPIPDDLRQDAVMQQAFSLINLLLSLNTQARDRSLKMRTYRVVPLTPAAGVLEWVQGTSPLFEYLVGSAVKVGAEPREVNGAHNRFYPKDRSHTSIRSLFSDNAAKSNSHKRALYRKCCSEFHPVFHNYFLENCPDPLTWYTRRLAYVRSVATSSMIGYIIGLGDRHASNILIDSATAELVHIDLGVAFEQGKQLPVPELVPFRLTRDIVHGMGVSGIHGVFSESCERTMDVMRQQHQFIESIVEVFLHDPLFKWTVSPGRAQRLQRGDLDTEDTDATKLPATATLDASSTLLRLKQKLVGTEFGDSLSVQGQVRKLVQDAMDEELLSRMFYGWAPWI